MVGVDRSLESSYSGSYTPKTAETSGMIYTLYINLLLCIILLAFFEANRYMRQIYLKRVTKKFERTNRVPEKPPRYFFGWIIAVLRVPEKDLLHMVGLDGYMLLRFIKVCFKASAFLTFWGSIVLIPIYSTASNDYTEWNKYTLANVFNGPTKSRLWVPAVFGYVFSAYFCHLLYSEYKNFVHKRVLYLVQSDPDTPLQSYYTVLVEHIPAELRSAPALKLFFEKIFPDNVYHVELALDLGELDSMVAERRRIRNNLEKANAYFFATKNRPTTWISQDFYKDPLNSAPGIRAKVYERSRLEYERVDAIQHYTRLLQLLNENVQVLQQSYLTQMQKIDHLESVRLKNKLDSRTGLVIEYVAEKTVKSFDMMRDLCSWAPPFYRSNSGAAINGSGGSGSGTSSDHNPCTSSLLRADTLQSMVAAPYMVITTTTTAATATDPSPLPRPPPCLTTSPGRISPNEDEKMNIMDDFRNREREFLRGNKNRTFSVQETLADVSTNGLRQQQQMMSSQMESSSMDRDRDRDGGIGEKESACQRFAGLCGLGRLAKSSIRSAAVAGKGALRGVLEATRTLEMITVGAYYKTSSTAFVTLKTRVANCSAHQMLLSHEYFRMNVTAAPNPRDIIWENVSIPIKQLKVRTNIANATLVVGALFWSSVVGFVNRLSNLDTLSQDWEWLHSYSDSFAYKLLNQYLAVVILVTLLSLLPIVFDIIARNYEGRKLESEIQNSIMARYFYYQLANVFVTITVGSLDLSQQIVQIISDPKQLVDILGGSLPGVSIYFANLIIVKIFASLPLELLRIWPLVSILCVKSCMDKKKCTRRDLRSGAFSDPPMLYGYIYPNQMMVLMIIVTYASIAPLLMPFGLVFFAFSYVMYKYQLLYVYINSYQSGGYMWYAVFNRSMVALMLGSLTLVGYLGLQLKNSLFSGPFYAIIPLPAFILYFWYYCDNKFKSPSENLSLEFAVELDRMNRTQKSSPMDSSFSPSLYRQPSLAEGLAAAEPYRRSRRGSMGGGIGGVMSSNSFTVQASRCSLENEEEDDEDGMEDHLEEVLGTADTDGDHGIGVGVFDAEQKRIEIHLHPFSYGSVVLQPTIKFQDI
eukprot:gene1199-2331_t